MCRKSICFGLGRVMTVKTGYFRGDIYENDKNTELQCGSAPILYDVIINWKIKLIFFSAATATKSTAEPYLSTLSQGELEKLGLKAVAAGANPQQLQQAFATAQLQGDWSKLEKLIADVLGIEAINSPQVGLGNVQL